MLVETYRFSVSVGPLNLTRLARHIAHPRSSDYRSKLNHIPTAQGLQELAVLLRGLVGKPSFITNLQELS